jgi:hypothetical protein
VLVPGGVPVSEGDPEERPPQPERNNAVKVTMLTTQTLLHNCLIEEFTLGSSIDLPGYSSSLFVDLCA